MIELRAFRDSGLLNQAGIRHFLDSVQRKDILVRSKSIESVTRCIVSTPLSGTAQESSVNPIQCSYVPN